MKSASCSAALLEQLWLPRVLGGCRRWLAGWAAKGLLLAWPGMGVAGAGGLCCARHPLQWLADSLWQVCTRHQPGLWQSVSFGTDGLESQRFCSCHILSASPS